MAYAYFYVFDDTGRSAKREEKITNYAYRLAYFFDKRLHWKSMKCPFSIIFINDPICNRTGII
jgi:hypothetical protein